MQAAARRTQLGEFRYEARREIVDAEVAEVFQTFRGLALARARKTRDDDEVRRRSRADAVGAGRIDPLDLFGGHAGRIRRSALWHPPCRFGLDGAEALIVYGARRGGGVRESCSIAGRTERYQP